MDFLLPYLLGVALFGSTFVAAGLVAWFLWEFRDIFR